MPSLCAGGMISKKKSAPHLSMEVAKGTITTSKLKVSAVLSAPGEVSPSLHANLGHPGRPGVGWSISEAWQSWGLRSRGKNAAHRRVSRGCFGKERVGKVVVVKGMWVNMK